MLQGLAHVQALGGLPTAASPAALAVAAASMTAAPTAVTAAATVDQLSTVNVPSGQSTAAAQPTTVSTLQGQTLTAAGSTHPSLASAASAAGQLPPHAMNMVTLQQLQMLAASNPAAAAQLATLSNGSGKPTEIFLSVK